MRKLFLPVILLLLLGALIMPAAAQEGTIVDIAVANEDFATLVAAAQAADPGILEALAGPGPLTVFAPTNQAFANLLSTLGLTADELLAQTEILNQVLLYHVVEGAVTSDQVVAFDGQSVPTLLEDNFIGVEVTDDGGVVLNGVVNVTAVDIIASNGVIHVIDNVLLPNPVLEALGLLETEATPEAAEEGEVAYVNIQVAHFSPDTPAVDVYVNGEAAITELEFGTITDFLTLEAGTYEIAVAPAGTSVEDAAIGPAEFDLPAGAFITVAAIGSLEAGTLTAAVLPQDFSELAEDQARVTVFHAIEDAPAVDVLAGGTPIITQLGFPGTLGDNDGAFTLDVPAGGYDLAVVPSGATEPVVLDLTGTTLDAGTYYFVAAIGTLETPDVALYAVDADTAAALNEALISGPMMDDMAMDMGTIADIVIASTEGDPSEFNILLAAVQAADPAILEAITGEGPLTVFAPTDAAFEAAFEALNVTAEDVLADTELLNQVLLYHVVEGAVTSDQVIELDGQSVATLQGESIEIAVVDGGVVLNGAINVVTVDIIASNGVVHVIDGVLLPPSIAGGM
jgi:transforming growth factor-beta-induced protein